MRLSNETDDDDDNDVEMRPLCAVDPSTSTSTMSKKFVSKPTKSNSPSMWRILFICGITIAIYLLYYLSSSIGNRPTSEIVKPKLTSKLLIQLQRRLSIAQKELDDKLRIQYGKYYEIIFFETIETVAEDGDSSGSSSNDTDKTTQTATTKLQPRGRNLFISGNSSSSLSRFRFQRKLTLKLLEASSSVSTKTTTAPTQFVWATGGHSATAGHGNYYNESYTSYLEQAIKPIFESVNIEFTGRNYAMGGTASASELALCTKEIYGTDIDVLVWDFGMTDGRDLWKQALYQYRGGLLNQSRPILLAFHAGNAEGGRYSVTQSMEAMGLGAMISSDDLLGAAENGIPDSFGLSEAGIQQLPEFVRNYRCGQQIENGDPYCGAQKFHGEVCPDRRFMTSWHPGWKWHALMGYLSAFFLLELLNETIQDLAVRLTTTNAVKLYNELKASESDDYATFQQSEVPVLIKDVLPPDGVDDFDRDDFVRGDNYCHTARLPAEIRHLGILTETTAQIGFYTYDKGISLNEMKSLVSSTSILTNSQLQLICGEDDRQECPIPLNMDHKDYFFIAANVGWQSLTVPNQSERNMYGIKVLKGYVAICFALCDWGKCPEDVLDRTALTETKWFQIRINQVSVSDMFSFQECGILRHADGYKFPVNTDSTMNVEARIVTPNNVSSYIRLGSLIVW
jgi:hypothetical protein